MRENVSFSMINLSPRVRVTLITQAKDQKSAVATAQISVRLPLVKIIAGFSSFLAIIQGNLVWLLYAMAVVGTFQSDELAFDTDKD